MINQRFKAPHWVGLGLAVMLALSCPVKALADSSALIQQIQVYPKTHELVFSLTEPKLVQLINLPQSNGTRIILDVPHITLKGVINKTELLAEIRRQLPEVSQVFIDEFRSSPNLVRIVLITKDPDYVGVLMDEHSSRVSLKLASRAEAQILNRIKADPSLGANWNHPITLPEDVEVSAPEASTPSSASELQEGDSEIPRLTFEEAQEYSEAKASSDNGSESSQQEEIPHINLALAKPDAEATNTVPTQTVKLKPAITINEGPEPKKMAIPLIIGRRADAQTSAENTMPPSEMGEGKVLFSQSIQPTEPVAARPKKDAAFNMLEQAETNPANKTAQSPEPKSNRFSLSKLTGKKTASGISTKAYEQKVFEAESLRRERNKLLDQLSGMQEQIKQQDQLLAIIKREQGKLVTLDPQQNQKTRIETLQAEMANLQQNYDELKTTYDGMTGTQEKLQSQIETMETEREQLKTQLSQTVPFPDPAQARGGLLNTLDSLTKAEVNNLLDAENAYREGKKLEFQGNANQAETRYSQAVRLAPQVSEYALALGVLESKQGNLASAKTVLLNALKYDEDNSLILNELGKVALIYHFTAHIV